MLNQLYRQTQKLYFIGKTYENLNMQNCDRCIVIHIFTSAESLDWFLILETPSPLSALKFKGVSPMLTPKTVTQCLTNGRRWSTDFSSLGGSGNTKQVW